MKKVAVWLSDEEQEALAQYCEKEGRSMYAVLKEAIMRTIQGESPITPKQDSNLVAPSVKTAQVVDLKSQERLVRLEKTIEKQGEEYKRLQHDVDSLKGNELLWQEIGKLREHEGQRTVILQNMQKELENKVDKKELVNIIAEVLERLGFRTLKERV